MKIYGNVKVGRRIGLLIALQFFWQFPDQLWAFSLILTTNIKRYKLQEVYTRAFDELICRD